MRKSSKCKYRSQIADPALAGAMDKLRDAYRIKEKMFPVSVFCGKGHLFFQKEAAEYKTLQEMAVQVAKEPWFGQKDSFIDRLDEDGQLIKTHVYREV